MMRHVALLPSLALALVACGNPNQALVGEWYAIPHYDRLTIAQQSGGLIATMSGSSFTVDTQQKPSSINLPWLGQVPLVLDKDSDTLSLGGQRFTRNVEVATAAYQNVGRLFAQKVMNEIYDQELMGADPNHQDSCSKRNLAGRFFFDTEVDSSIRECSYVWNPDERDLTVNLTLPLGHTLVLGMKDFASDLNDLSLISGRWTHLIDAGETVITVNTTPRGKDQFIGHLEYAGRLSCRANLYIEEHRGNSYRVRVGEPQGMLCPEWQASYWLAASPRHRGGLGATVPRPQPEPLLLFQSPQPFYLGDFGDNFKRQDTQGEVEPYSPEAEPASSPAQEAVQPSEPPASATATMPRAFSLRRPTLDPIKQGLPRLYDQARTASGGDGSRCALISSEERVKACRVTVSPNQAYTWGSAWCSGSSAAFQAFKRWALVRFEIDGSAADSNQFWTEETDRCLRRRLIVQGVRPGAEHHFKIMFDLARELRDGADRYPPGHYELNLAVTGAAE